MNSPSMIHGKKAVFHEAPTTACPKSPTHAHYWKCPLPEGPSVLATCKWCKEQTEMYTSMNHDINPDVERP